MVLGNLNYKITNEEVKINLHKEYESLPDVMKMDCLNDAISDLENKRKALHKKLYGDE